MKKIDRKLLGNYGVSADEKKEFAKFVTENVKLGEINKFLKWIINGWVITLNILLAIGCGILFFVVGISITDSSGDSSSGLKGGIPFVLLAIAFLVIAIVGFAKRRKVVRNSVKEVDLLKISQKWFSYYGIKEDDVYTISLGNVLGHVNKYRLSPKDARIEKASTVVCFEMNKIQTGLVNIGWLWTRRYTDSKGRTQTRTYRLSQFYTMTIGFKDTWNGFQMELHKGKTILRKKHETLENEAFNKAYNYHYNDGVKIRRILTPAIQETLLKDATLGHLRYYFDQDTFITTIRGTYVGTNFSPLEINLGFVGANENAIKKKVSHDMVTDYLGIMNVLSHNQIFYQLYKK